MLKNTRVIFLSGLLLSLFFVGVGAQALNEDLSITKQSLGVENASRVADEFVKKILATKSPSELKKVFVHSGVVLPLMALGGAACCVDGAEQPAAITIFISYILLRMCFCENSSEKEESRKLMRNFDEFIKNLSSEFGGLPESEKLVLTEKLVDCVDKIKHKEKSKKIFSWIVDHLIPLFPAGVLADVTAKIGIDFSGKVETINENLPGGGFHFGIKDGSTNAWEVVRFRRTCLFVLYYVIIIGLFDYGLVSDDASVDLIKQIESDIDYLKLPVK